MCTSMNCDFHCIEVYDEFIHFDQSNLPNCNQILGRVPDQNNITILEFSLNRVT